MGDFDEIFYIPNRPTEPTASVADQCIIYLPSTSFLASFPFLVPLSTNSNGKGGGGEEEQLNVGKLNRQQQIPFNHRHHPPSFPTALTRD